VGGGGDGGVAMASQQTGRSFSLLLIYQEIDFIAVVLSGIRFTAVD
jgi:hypothetical protein